MSKPEQKNPTNSYKTEDKYKHFAYVAAGYICLYIDSSVGR